MGQVNVNPGGSREYREVRERSSGGAAAVVVAILGVVLLLGLLWFAMTQGWFGGNTTVINQPAERVERNTTDRTVIDRERQLVPQQPAGNVGGQTGTAPGGTTGTAPGGTTGTAPGTGATR
jgi:hypothetical protein